MKKDKVLIFIIILIVFITLITVVLKGNKFSKKSMGDCIKECERERGTATWNGTPAYGGKYEKYWGKYDCKETCDIINK